MHTIINSCATYGINAFKIEIETNIEATVPNFFLVGLPDNAIKESRERVSTAIKNSGFNYPNRRITINLAPADIKKEGSSYDLPIAIGILSASEQIKKDKISEFIILGELSLEGNIRKVHGVLPIAVEIKKIGFKNIIVPFGNETEASMVDGLNVFPVKNLKDAVEILNSEKNVEPVKINIKNYFLQEQKFPIDYSDVKGQESVKRALEIACAGSHNLIMIGPPGSGKTMLAKRIPSILPPLSFDESIETTKIHSVAGVLPSSTSLVATRPFRSPHHTISDSALVGGGTIPRPGEISLSHHGVLFLDELPEFARNVLEVLRQPLEDKKVTISRSKLTIDYPSNFMLVCAMNPCSCGNFGNPQKKCSCNPLQIQKYLSKISGPLLDRIDIHIEVPAIKIDQLNEKKEGEKSEKIRERVIAARNIQNERYNKNENVFSNSNMQTSEIKEFCKLTSESETVLKNAMSKLGLSARAYDRILKVARTIADLSASSDIKTEHIAEAIQYRSLDRNYWNF